MWFAPTLWTNSCISHLDVVGRWSAEEPNNNILKPYGLVRSTQLPVDDSPTNYVILYDYTLFSIVLQVLLIQIICQILRKLILYLAAFHQMILYNHSYWFSFIHYFPNYFTFQIRFNDDFPLLKHLTIPANITHITLVRIIDSTFNLLHKAA